MKINLASLSEKQERETEIANKKVLDLTAEIRRKQKENDLQVILILQ